MKNNSYKLTIFDDHYAVVSDETLAHVNQAATMVDTLMKEIASKLSQVDEKRVAVLVALQLASKALLLENQIEHVSVRHKELLDRIEHECIALLRRS